MKSMHIVVFGLSLSSSWGNGHATTYRALLKALVGRGHQVLFLERDQPWYAANRDLVKPDFCELSFYDSVCQLGRYQDRISRADVVIVGSYVPDGIAVGRFVQRVARGIRIFYDIDTPVTLASLKRGECDYLSPELIPGYHLYLSFTGGPTLGLIEKAYGSPAARPLYCSVDPNLYSPTGQPWEYDLGYLGTYSLDRQASVGRLLITAARQAPSLSFIVGGSQYPTSIEWPRNVTRVEHVAPRDHSAFYNSCRFSLNVTRADMVRAGHSPSVRLFESSACGVPLISDVWDGLDRFFRPKYELELAGNASDVLCCLQEMPENARQAMGERARGRVLTSHTAAHRAVEFETYIGDAGRVGKMSGRESLFACEAK